MNVIRNRLPTPAMLLACVALVVALGGVSYAAAVLPENSVGTPQLKKKSVTRAKLKKDAVTGVKVKNGSLMAADFKAGQFPAGPQARRGRRETLARQDHRVSRGLGIVKKTETTSGVNESAFALCPRASVRSLLAARRTHLPRT